MSLHLDALAWGEPEARYRLDPDPLAVAPGEVAVVVAAEPAATRFADLLVGLEAPLEGTIGINGDEVTRLPPGRRRIGLVPPGGELLPHLTVEHNLTYGLRRDGAAPVGRDRARYLAERHQLDGVARQRPHELSPVQRLRAAGIRALCQDPEPLAVVVEDRSGHTPCLPAVAVALSHNVAVVVVTDDPSWTTTLSVRWHARVIDAD